MNQIQLQFKQSGDKLHIRTSQFCAGWHTGVTYKKVVSIITNSCVRRAVIVIIIVVYLYRFKQWHISSANNKVSLIKTKHMFVFSWFVINELIYKSF